MLCLTVVFTIGQIPKTYEKQKAERFYILFSPVRVYVIVQDLSTMIVRKISKINTSIDKQNNKIQTKYHHNGGNPLAIDKKVQTT